MCNVISIYSGAGGLDLGFKKAGFEVLYSTDNWSIACDTIKINNTSKIVECNDIRNIMFDDIVKNLCIEEVDCLIGGPPCPPYSKSRFYLKEKKRALEDSSSYTLVEYFRAVKELKPKVFFFENVHGFVYKPHNAALEYLIGKAHDLGYNVKYRVVNAADYGIPQIRKRFICVGTRKDVGGKFIFPKASHCDPSKSGTSDSNFNPWVSAGKVLNNIDYDLPEDVDMQAGSKHKDLLKLIPPGDNYLYFTKERGHPKPMFIWRSRYWSFLLKLSPEKPSWTIQASFSNNQGPFHWKNRYLRIQEIKRLQTFDDEYIITGQFKDQWRQIGNAVPPLLAEVIAKAIKQQYFDGVSNKEYVQIEIESMMF